MSLRISGTLSEIRRLYVQNGKVIRNSNTNVPGIPTSNSITDAFCAAQKTATGDTNNFAAHGGLATMGAALQKGMVLAMSLWDDHEAEICSGSTATTRSTLALPRPVSPVALALLPLETPSNSVTFSNIKTGPIGSTFSATGGGGSITTATTTTTSTGSAPSGGSVAKFGQCGGQGYTGPTACAAGSTWQVLNPFFFQCL
ncbi:cellobiohydrolase-like protein [Mycena vulgaris]|nr:cellobiohydrolase-like protein [Mycena vulgaris]